MGHKRFTEDEIKKVLELKQRGFTGTRIAEEMGRPLGSVCSVLARLKASKKLGRVVATEAPVAQPKRPMLALFGDRDEVAKTIKELFS